MPYRHDLREEEFPNESREYTHCSKCGGEKDSEGWCANHCTDDDPPLEIKKQ